MVSRPINAMTENAPYLPKGRPTNCKLGTQLEEYENPHHRHAGFRTPKVKGQVTRSRRQSGVCLPITRQRKVTETPILARLPPRHG